MKTNRTNWIKLPEHETESFTHTLRYFTLLGRSWFGQHIFLKVMHYRNSVLYTALLLSEFHNSAMQISLHLMRIWGIYTLARGVHWRCLVATRFGGFTYLFYNFMIMLIESKGTIIILWNPMLISGDTLFCISQKDDFNLHWHDIIDTQNHSSV